MPRANVDHEEFVDVLCPVCIPFLLYILYTLCTLRHKWHLSLIIFPMVSQCRVSFILFCCFPSSHCPSSFAFPYGRLLWEHIQWSSLSQRQDWNFQSLLNDHSKRLEISQMKEKACVTLHVCTTHVFWSNTAG